MVSGNMDDDLLLCECGHEGRERLEHIATTKTGAAPRKRGSFKSLKTGFYVCSGCSQVFKHTVHKEGEIPDEDFANPKTIPHFTPYKRGLSCNDILMYGGRCRGDIDVNDEVWIGRIAHK